MDQAGEAPRDVPRRLAPLPAGRNLAVRRGGARTQGQPDGPAGRAQLQSLSTWQARRARIAALYDLRLADLPTVRRPHRAHASTGRHAWHLYAVQLSDAAVRDEVAAALARQGIGTSVHFIPVHRLTHFSSLLPPDGLPGADRMFDRLLSLPLYPRLTTHQVDDITASLADALEGVER
jgi:dTDP-4-amino-4,6-dideoxygalactose transaminase